MPRLTRAILISAVPALAGGLLLWVGEASGAALADAGGGERVPAGAGEMSVPTSTGERRMRVATPDAFQSDAGDGWRLRGRVVVRSADQDAINRALAVEAGVGAPRRFWDGPGPLAEFWLVDAPSVARAVALARVLAASPGISEAYVDTYRPRGPRNPPPTDPGFAQQWFLNGPGPAGSVGAMSAWNAGITGAGVTVGVIEEGFNVEHPDLIANVDLAASQAPINGYTFIDHTTACAGLVAMARNGIGGVGVAYGAKVSRIYYGFDTDTAAAFVFRNDLNAIKTNSWGPPDTATLGAMSSVELAALETAGTVGRGGLGTVLVWAAGNGGFVNDRVEYDPYASNRHAIAVGAIGPDDQRAPYSEAGSALMLVTTSSPALFPGGSSGVYSTVGSDTVLPGQYTSGFGGTSAAAPIAAGAVALALEANPALSARDAQHLLISTARRVRPDDESWSLNGAGRWVSEVFGFGAVDAGAAVARAPHARPLPARIVAAQPERTLGVSIPDEDAAGKADTVIVPPGLRVERVEVTLSVDHPRVGDLRVVLTSPSGTVSLLADARSDFGAGFSAYTLSSVRCWDEPAGGAWTLRVSDLTPGLTGEWTSWRLTIVGSAPICPPDYNASATADIDDVFVFLNRWFSGGGDFDGSGAATIDDIFVFLNAWFAGC
jgi:kexin